MSFSSFVILCRLAYVTVWGLFSVVQGLLTDAICVCLSFSSHTVHKLISMGATHATRVGYEKGFHVRG